MARITVNVDEDDLAVIKAAAAAQGVASGELIRQAVHLRAMAERRWSEPFFGYSSAWGERRDQATTHAAARGRDDDGASAVGLLDDESWNELLDWASLDPETSSASPV
jgi:Ribbon-helix-helix protein, copG family